MANVKISALPSYTGSAADLRWFVMNNSGETETFKYSGYSSPFVRNIRDSYYTPTSNNITSAGYYNTILNGTGNTITNGSVNAILNGYDNTITTPLDGNNIIGGYGNTISNGLLGGNGIYSSFLSSNSNGSTGAVIASYAANIVSGYRSIVAATYEGIINAGTGCAVIATYGRINGSGNDYDALLGGIDNTLTSSKSSVIIGGDNQALTSSDKSSIVGGANNAIFGGNFNTGIFTSYNSSIQGTGAYNAIIAGSTNSIARNISSTIIGSSQSSIDGNVGQAGVYNTIIGSTAATIAAGYDYVMMLGLTSGKTATASATTYVENLHLYRTPSTQVQSISSGTTFTCNLELGAKSQFYITGTSTINITNVRDGASFMIKTQTDGNYVMTWTSPGYTFLFEGGLKDPGNTTIDIFKFEVFGNIIYGSRAHNFS